ncbi:MAG TPA: hypothetical protein VN652_03700 [Geobacteraceae bacterium]|nr:hypothetical protein [Geobacteraceae bacterium]
MHPDSLPETDNYRVACQQILEKDHSVFSIQWIILPSGSDHGLTSEMLLQLYLDYVRRFTLGIINSFKNDNGIEFRLTGSSVAIIRFSPPLSESTTKGEKTTLRISGGLLVQPKERDRGEFEFFVESVESGCRVALKLSGFYPFLLGSSRPLLWRKWLYRLTQAYIHKVVTIRFLAMIYRKYTGEKLKKGVIRIALRKGSNI